MSKSGKDGAVGVLNDFDLATMQGTVRGNEHTGTVPFMAIELLSGEGWQAISATSMSTTWSHSSGCLCGSVSAMTKANFALRAIVPWMNGGKQKPPHEPAKGYESIWPLIVACMQSLHLYVGWANPAPSSDHKPTFEEKIVKPYESLIKGPIETVKSANPNFVELRPPCNFHEVA
ncbi:hypothetical protein EV363DRAFT_1459939 [Boletus edulis]|nr:hypothetical protein EV363DRAFT_1459939 [Boletus edulis]